MILKRPFDRRLVSIAFLCFLLSSGAAFAEFSGNIALTSDYVFRGISQTLEDPALQVEVSWATKGGFYVGAWGSNVDFGSEADFEVDVFLGLAGKSDGGFGWDVGVIHFNFPNEDELNFEELYAEISFGSVSIKYSVSDDFIGTGGEATYLEAALSFAVGKRLDLELHAGTSEFDDAVGILDYMDYSATLSRRFKRVGVALAYHDTDKQQFGELDGERVVGTLSFDF